ncbi:MAG: peptidyl-prolyl cis-trans isomerase [bacterium]|nr:peptidyl-prolyl cis-trans isomerase [bacterium]
MRKAIPAILALSVVLLFAACGEEGTVLANIGDGAVTVENLQRTATLLGDQGLIQTGTSQGREQLLEKSIQMEVLYQSALAAGVDKLPDVQAQLEQSARDVVISNYLRISFANYGFSEDEFYDYYKNHAAELVSPTQANVRHILTENQTDASRVLAELQGGADFTQLAAERSTDRMSAMNGGRLPVLSPDNQVLPPYILQTIFSAKVGEPFGPLESQMGWHVFVVDAFNPGKPLSFDEAKPQIVLALLAPEADVRAYYDAHRDEFDRPDAVSLRYILSATREDAERVIARAAAGEDLGKIASEVSLDAATKDGGGLIPRLFRGRSLPLFSGTGDDKTVEEKAFSIKPGGISEPFELSRGWAVIQVLDFTPGEASQYETVRAQAQSKLFETRVRAKEQEFYDALETNLGVKRNEEAITAYLQSSDK